MIKLVLNKFKKWMCNNVELLLVKIFQRFETVFKVNKWISKSDIETLLSLLIYTFNRVIVSYFARTKVTLIRIFSVFVILEFSQNNGVLHVMLLATS